MLSFLSFVEARAKLPSLSSIGGLISSKAFAYVLQVDPTPLTEVDTGLADVMTVSVSISTSESNSRWE
jgi:hypothetical protein